VGTGWSRTEFRALGVGDRFDDRGALTDESLDVMLSCLRSGPQAHDGPTFGFQHADVAPAPAQRPHPPLWVGGTKGAALRRAGRLADVWHPNDLTPAELKDAGDRLDDLAGRAVPRSVRFDTTDDRLRRIVDLVDEYLAVGATRVVLEFRGRDTEDTTRRAGKAAEALFG
jgi:alkanesulfonate monooxygenase SsuD/methylene tetrahydromethanopterin reductase-like flavin-dependent oxidoreductase (luciferase family)